MHRSPVFAAVLPFLAIALCHASPASAQPSPSRARIGVALGGGSARGLAHVGVLRWLEEHRIPIDVLAGTSMGGLVGGAYATGMPPADIEALMAETDWSAMFGGSRFDFLNVRRKRDLRAYPSHLEFGLKRGIVLPTSLNSGQQVDLLLARIAAPYYAATTFDDLPTPFRCVAVDLRTARFVVLDRGSLAEAMRATMSLPLVFPPVTIDGQVLVDGGAMNNIPADVVRQMGADRVIAVNVGDLNDRAEIEASLFGMIGSTLDAMMRANTLKALAAADVVVDVPLKEYGSLDWRRYSDLIREGYDAAEAMKARLLPLAIDDAAWQQWRAARETSRRTSSPAPAFVRIEGAGTADTALMQRTLAVHVGRPLDVAALEATLTELGGLDRYQSLTWRIVGSDGDGETADGLLITAHPKSYGPPFVFLGISLENTTSNEFRFGLSGRYLAFDVAGSASELRLDAAVGSDPSVAMALYRPLWSTPFFVEPIVGTGLRTFSVIANDRVIATYRQARVAMGADVGINLGRLDEVRAGAGVGRLDASVRVGDPGLPELGGREASMHLRWTHDGQDNAVLPSRGIHANAGVKHMFDAPSLPDTFPLNRTSEGVTQAEAIFSWMHSLTRTRARRIFVMAGAGTSFDGSPLPTDQFPLGGPLRLSGFSVGERRGDHYALLTGGYLHQMARLPDFLGGPVFLGGWLESGAAFDRRPDADFSMHTGVAVIADTLIGPVFGGAGIAFDGSNRFYIGIGRIFR